MKGIKMGKKFASISVSFLMAFLVYGTFDCQVAFAKSEKTYRLNLAHSFPPVSVMHKHLSAWVQKIEKESNGRIKVTIFFRRIPPCGAGHLSRSRRRRGGYWRRVLLRRSRYSNDFGRIDFSMYSQRPEKEDRHLP